MIVDNELLFREIDSNVSADDSDVENLSLVGLAKNESSGKAKNPVEAPTSPQYSISKNERPADSPKPTQEQIDEHKNIPGSVDGLTNYWFDKLDKDRGERGLLEPVNLRLQVLKTEQYVQAKTPALPTEADKLKRALVDDLVQEFYTIARLHDNWGDDHAISKPDLKAYFQMKEYFSRLDAKLQKVEPTLTQLDREAVAKMLKSLVSEPQVPKLRGKRLVYHLEEVAEQVAALRGSDEERIARALAKMQEQDPNLTKAERDETATMLNSLKKRNYEGFSKVVGEMGGDDEDRIARVLKAVAREWNGPEGSATADANSIIFEYRNGGIVGRFVIASDGTYARSVKEPDDWLLRSSESFLLKHYPVLNHIGGARNILKKN